MVYGLLGRKLGHSWSAPIHQELGCDSYRLIELEVEEKIATIGELVAFVESKL